MYAGIYEELVPLIGFEKTYQIYLNMRGQQRTFPQYFYKSSYVKQIIATEYTGDNCKELAQKYNYTERYIRQLLHQSVELSNDTPE